MHETKEAERWTKRNEVVQDEPEEQLYQTELERETPRRVKRPFRRQLKCGVGNEDTKRNEEMRTERTTSYALPSTLHYTPSPLLSVSNQTTASKKVTRAAKDVTKEVYRDRAR